MMERERENLEDWLATLISQARLAPDEFARVEHVFDRGDGGLVASAILLTVASSEDRGPSVAVGLASRFGMTDASTRARALRHCEVLEAAALILRGVLRQKSPVS